MPKVTKLTQVVSGITSRTSPVADKMIIGAIEKYDIRAMSTRSTLYVKLMSLMPGEGFVCSGTERDIITSVIAQIRKEEGGPTGKGKKRKISTHRIEPMKYRVVRVE